MPNQLFLVQKKFNDVINLLKNFMDGSKIIPTTNKDIHLALQILKKVITDVEIATYKHFIPYANILHKRKRVQE